MQLSPRVPNPGSYLQVLNSDCEGKWETGQVSSCQILPSSRSFSNNCTILTNNAFRSSPILSKNCSPSLLSCQQWVSVTFWMHQHPQAADLGFCVATSVCQSHVLNVYFCLSPFCLCSQSCTALNHLCCSYIFDKEEPRSSDVSRGNWELQHHLSETASTPCKNYTGMLKISFFGISNKFHVWKTWNDYPQPKIPDL